MIFISKFKSPIRAFYFFLSKMISQKISQFIKQVAIEHYSSIGHTFDEENETIVFSFLYYPDDYLVFTSDYPK